MPKTSFPREYEILFDSWCFIYMISHLTSYPYDILCILGRGVPYDIFPYLVEDTMTVIIVNIPDK